MQKNSQNFSMQEAIKLANSETGQRLLAILKQNDPAQLQKVMSLASTGQQQELSKALSQMLASPEAQALLKQLGGSDG